MAFRNTAIRAPIRFLASFSESFPAASFVSTRPIASIGGRSCSFRKLGSLTGHELLPGRACESGLQRIHPARPLLQRHLATVSAEKSPDVTNARVSDCREYLEVTWSDGRTTKYPWVWLKDNCQCSACFQPTAKARLSLMENLDLECQPSKVEKTDGSITISWNDGHESKFEPSWLHERSFSDEERAVRSTWYKNERVPWPQSFDASGVKRLKFKDVIESDSSLLEFLTTLEAYGLVLIEDAPKEEGMIHRIAGRIAFIRTTNYGKEFTVKAKLDPSNAAYTGSKLGLHTDLVYYDYMPGIQFLHCLVQAVGKGGGNQFSDGMAAAENLRQQNRECYDVLTTVPVDFYDVGKDYYEFHKIQRRPVIQSNSEGEVHRINYNNQVRDSFLNVPLDRVKPLYRALKLFDQGLYKNAVHLKLREGDIVVFDNMRVLHGRDSFNFDATTSRHLQGGYTDWDDVRSRIRVLRAGLATDS